MLTEQWQGLEEGCSRSIRQTDVPENKLELAQKSKLNLSHENTESESDNRASAQWI